MALPQTVERFDLESYLAWEAEQPEKHEYQAGEAFAMVGARLPHNAISGNIFSSLKQALRGSSCRAWIDGTKLRIEAADAVLYPDVMVGGDPRDNAGDDRFISHPVLLVEVLSEATAACDRGAKFALYRQLDTLREYLIVDPDSRRVELFRRDAEGRWVLFDFTGQPAVELATLSLKMSLADIFEDVSAAG